jgi:type II secretory pathway pseudopilin PulG
MKRLLTVVALITVASFLGRVIVPNILSARSRSRQKRTLADIRAIATAWEARATDRNTYSIGKKISAASQHVTTSALQAALSPTYIRWFPRTDPWGHEYQYTISDFDEAHGAGSYAIRALGSDGKADAIGSAPAGATRSFTADVIYSNGSFLQYPEEAG